MEIALNELLINTIITIITMVAALVLVGGNKNE